ncbi:MAG: PilN domain-containing protein [Candidatus Saccharimonadales bacterium]
MLQFNLLPDVKMEYIRAQRLKQTVVSISAVVAGAALTLLILLFLVVDVFQKAHLKDVNTDIATNTSKLQSITDLNKILTVQNQLNSLPALHAQKPVASRLFNYIGQVVPAKVNISSLNLDFTQKVIQLNGTADSISTVNKFVDTLKFATYASGGSNKKAFSNVVLSSFSRSDKDASYAINLNFDSAIFDVSQNITSLTVPNIITTRSELDAPTTVFGAQPTSNKGTR